VIDIMEALKRTSRSREAVQAASEAAQEEAEAVARRRSERVGSGPVNMAADEHR